MKERKQYQKIDKKKKRKATLDEFIHKMKEYLEQEQEISESKRMIKEGHEDPFWTDPNSETEVYWLEQPIPYQKQEKGSQVKKRGSLLLMLKQLLKITHC